MCKGYEMNDSVYKDFINSLKESQEDGTLRLTVSKNGDCNIKLKVRAIIKAFIESMGEIPLPITIYNDLKQSLRGEDFKTVLVGYLALLNYEFIENDRNLDSLKGIVDISNETFIYQIEMIGFFFDLDNPRIDIKKPFYWFRVREKHIEGLMAVAKEQYPRMKKVIGNE